MDLVRKPTKLGELVPDPFAVLSFDSQDVSSGCEVLLFWLDASRDVPSLGKSMPSVLEECAPP